MIGVLSTVPGTVTRRSLSRDGAIPVAWLVALGRVGVSPNIGQSVNVAAALGAAVGVALAVAVAAGLGLFPPPHAATESMAVSVTAQRIIAREPPRHRTRAPRAVG